MGDRPGQRNLMMRAETRSSSGNSSTLSSDSSISMASDPNKVDLKLAGSDEAHPLLLYTQILLSPRPAIYVESPFPVDIYHGLDTSWKIITICCQDARKLEIDHPTLLVPRAPLQTDFERGWVRLPTEIKLQILSYCIPTGVTVGQESKKEHKVLARYLHMTPEISELCKEIFYASNTLELLIEYDEHDGTLSNTAFMKFPPRCVLPYIRRVEIKTSLNAWPDTWNALDSINTLNSLSKSLESATVNLYWEPVVLGASDARLLEMESIQGIDEWIDAYALKDPERQFLFFNFKVNFVFTNKPRIIVMSNAPDITAPAPVTEFLELMIKAQVSFTSLRV